MSDVETLREREKKRKRGKERRERQRRNIQKYWLNDNSR
jgi:hypothetical protein